MYGLFLYMYDYHEWEDFICCSEDEGKLGVHWSELSTGWPLVEVDEHDSYRDQEMPHYIIKLISVI